MLEMDCASQYAKSELNFKLIMELDSYITSAFIPESVLRQKYLENRLSLRDIAHEFACSKTRVRSLMLKYKIPRRQTSDYRGSRWHAYGRRKVNGKTVDHRGEQKTIAAIRKMYAEGINTVAIARCLNAMKVPTKRQGKGWHQNTVATILKREGVYVERRKGRAASA